MSINPLFPRDKQEWETLSPAPVASQAGAFVVSSPLKNMQYAHYFRANNAVYFYNPYEDGYTQLANMTPTSNTTGGSAGCWVYRVPTTYSNLSTAINVMNYVGEFGYPTYFRVNTTGSRFFPPYDIERLAEQLPGIEMQLIDTSNAGMRRQIVTAEVLEDSTTIEFSIDRPFSNAMYSPFASAYFLIGHIVTFINNGTTGSGVFNMTLPGANVSSYVDLNAVGLPTGMGTNVRLMSTPSVNGPYFTGSVTSATSNTLVDNSTNFSNFPDGNFAWVDYQVRILAGTGEGQIRTIASHTSNQLTISGSWSTVPDSTSKYGVEPNDDYIWMGINNSTTTYRYKFSTNTWESASAFVNRGSTGTGLLWIDSPAYRQVITGSAARSGRYFYHFDGLGFGTVYKVYTALALSANSDSNQSLAEPTGVGSSYVADINDGTIYYTVNNTGRTFEYSALSTWRRTTGLSTDALGQSTAVIGNRLFVIYAKDRKGDYIKYLYHLHNTSNVVRRLRLS